MEWIKVDERLPEYSDILMAKRENGEIVKCYFHHDRMNWLNFYGQKTTHWQRKDNLSWIDDVVEWKEK